MSGEQIKPGYKRTEVGVIPEDWGVHLLEDICKRITTGKLDANAMVKDGIYPFFTCARERYFINDYAFDDEALLVSGNGANVGYIHYYDGKFNAYQRTYVLTGFTADIQFSKLFMEKSLHARLRTEVNAGNTPYIVMDTLAKMFIPIPPTLHEQRSIATALSDVDALLTKLDQLIAKKRDFKQATMQKLLTGQTRLPGFSGKWEVKRLGDIVEIRKGQLITEKDAIHGDIPVIAGGKKPSYFHNRPNRVGKTITVSASGASAGYVAFFDSPIFASDCSTISDGKMCSIEFIYFQLLLKQDEIYRAQTGGAQPHIHAVDLIPLEVGVCSFEEQAAIANILADIDAELASLEARRYKTRALKQGMMQELLTGRIRLV